MSRDGTITFPEIGPVDVAGLTLEQLRDAVTQRVSEQMIGVRASVTLGELRSIRVFVLGDVVRPGSYLVQQPVHDDERAVHERRREAGRLAAQRRIDARRQYDFDVGSL